MPRPEGDRRAAAAWSQAPRRRRAHPNFVVLGNGRAIIEVDGPHHYGRTRQADDAARDRHWARCGVPAIRITSEHADDPGSLKALFQEDLRRQLWRS